MVTNLIDGKYLPLPKQFISKGFNHVFDRELGNGWMIYRRNAIELNRPHFELIQPYKQEGFTICGNDIPPKIKYPTAEDFGTYGFVFPTIEACLEKYEKIKNPPIKEEQNPVIWPDGKFTLKELAENNPKYNISKLSAIVKKDKNIKVVGEKSNKRGRSSKVYKKL